MVEKDAGFMMTMLGQCRCNKMHGPQDATICDDMFVCVLPTWPDILHRVSTGNNWWWFHWFMCWRTPDS